MTDVTLAYVPLDVMDRYWPVAEPMLQLAQVRYDHEYGMEDLKDAVYAGKCRLWLILVEGKPRAAMTTYDEVHPRRTSLLIELLGGEGISEWAEAAVVELSRVARDAGYDAIRTNARSGWIKMAKQYNFTPKHVAYEMELH